MCSTMIMAEEERVLREGGDGREGGWEEYEAKSEGTEIRERMRRGDGCGDKGVEEKKHERI